MSTESKLKIQGYIMKYLRQTVLWIGFHASRDELNTILNRHFADGKRAADFAGMISQSTLCLFFSSYLFKQSNLQSNGFFERQALGMSALMFLVICIYIWYKTMKVTIYYFMRDASNNKTVIGKVYPVIISIVSGACFYYGQFAVVQAIVKSNALLK